jgi:hypothetical protein
VSTNRTIRASAGRALLVPSDREDAERVLSALGPQDVSPGALRTLRAAVSYASRRPGEAPRWCASAAKLAAKAGFKDRTSVAKYLRELRDAGIVQVDGEAWGRSKWYSVAFPVEWFARLDAETPLASLICELAEAREDTQRLARVPASPWSDAVVSVPAIREAVRAVFGREVSSQLCAELNRRLVVFYAGSCRRHEQQAARGDAWQLAAAEVAAGALRHGLTAPSRGTRVRWAFAALDRAIDADETYERLKAARERLSPAGFTLGGFRPVPRDDSYGDAPLPARLAAAAA